MDKSSLLVDGEILIYGDIGDYFWGDGVTTSQVAAALAEHGPGDVVVRINSGGGLVFDGMAIFSLLKSHGGSITIAIDGVAASAASLIAMAGDRIEMRTGAMIMIHDPATFTSGNAAAHEKTAQYLDKLGAQYAQVYAERSGQTAERCRDLMLAETWMSAAEAVDLGFATAIVDAPAEAVAAFDYSLYRKAPASFPIRRPRAEPAAAAATKETIMKMDVKDPAADPSKADKKDEPAARAVVIDKPAADKTNENPTAAAPKPWAASFYASAERTGVTLADLNAIVAKSATHEQAKDALIDVMAGTSNLGKPSPAGARAEITADGRDRWVEGVTRSIVAKSKWFTAADGKPSSDGERNEFSGYTLRELARMSLDRVGQRYTGHDPMKMIAMAFTPVMSSGMHTTSDFVNVLANVANKALLKGYEEAPETFMAWTGRGNLSDFKIATRVDTGLFPSLGVVPEGGEYQFATLSDRKETIALATYGRMFGISRQAIINDDLDVFTRVPGKMGQAARRTIGNLVYAILTSNPTMSDGTALFHANHKNLAGSGSALAAGTLDAGRAGMAKQKDPDEHAAALGIRPAYLIVPVSLEGAAQQLIASQTEPGQSNPGVANRVAGMAQVVAEARLDASSTTAWYLAANGSQYDTIEVAYLNGIDTPTLEQKDGWNVDQVEMKVRLDAGVKAWEWRTLYKATGAA